MSDRVGLIGFVLVFGDYYVTLGASEDGKTVTPANMRTMAMGLLATAEAIDRAILGIDAARRLAA